jgi:hypothetical protein
MGTLDINEYYQSLLQNSPRDIPVYQPASVSPTEDGGYQVIPEKQIRVEKADRSGPAAYGQPTTVGVPAMLHSVSASEDIIANMETRLRILQETSGGDTIALSKGLAQLDADVAMKKADIYKEIQSLSLAKYQVPSLQKALQESIALDDKSPGFRQKYGSTDSSETGAIRSQLNQAMAAADGAINEGLKGNSVYQSIDTAAATFRRTAETLIFKNMAKDEQVAAAAQDAYNRYTPEQKKTWDMAIGNTDSNPVMAIAHYKALPAKGREELNQVVEGGNIAIPALTLSGNVFAKRIAIQKEAEVSGDANIAAAKVESLVNIASDSTAAFKAYETLKKVGLISPTDAKALDIQVKTSLDPRLSSGANKEEAAKLRRFVAMKVARAETTKAFNSDITHLSNNDGIPVPSFLAQAQNSPAFSNKKLSLDDAITIANAAPSTQERQKNLNELGMYYSAAIKKQNQSPLFTVDPLAVEQLKAKAVLQGFNLVGKVSDALSSNADKTFPIDYLTDPIAVAARQEVRNAGKAVQGFFVGTPKE